MSKLKVFGTLTFQPGHAQQVRTIAATTSQRKFAALIGQTLHEVQVYAGETGNQEELSVAFGRCETAFFKCNCCGTWIKLESKGGSK